MKLFGIFFKNVLTFSELSGSYSIGNCMPIFGTIVQQFWNRDWREIRRKGKTSFLEKKTEFFLSTPLPTPFPQVTYLRRNQNSFTLKICILSYGKKFVRKLKKVFITFITPENIQNVLFILTKKNDISEKNGNFLKKTRKNVCFFLKKISYRLCFEISSSSRNQ